MTDHSTQDSPLLPSLAIVVASILWGVYWIPMREMQALGVEKAWPSLILNGAVLILLLPVAIWRARRFLADFKALMISGLIMGTALTCYGTSLNLTDVVRAILLFYLSPAWSTIIGLIWLGERLTARRIAALLLGFAGLMVVLKAETGFPWPEGLGDWIAILAGLAWSVGSARIFVNRKSASFELSFAFVLGTVLSSAALVALFPATAMGPVPELDAMRGEGLWVVPAACAVLIPIYVLTIWGAQRLPPATVGILLLGEIVVAVLSAAWLLPEEPFGKREVLGALLIAGAGIMEVLPRRRRTA